MQRFFIYLSYNGRPYCGWQKQPSGRSVQSCLEDALSVLLKRHVSVVGCGRTDTGVNASAFFAHFDCEEEVPEALRSSWVYKLNALLDKAIAIHSIFEVDSNLHARFSATRRTYHYYLHTAKDPFLEDSSYYCRFPFDAGLIREAGQNLCGYRDFTSFSKLHTQVKTNFCRLERADLERLDAHRWRFVFTADRFLRNMVRALVGTLLGVGKGRYSLEDLKGILEAKDRCRAGTSMPAHALYLAEVKYFDTPVPEF